MGVICNYIIFYSVYTKKKYGIYYGSKNHHQISTNIYQLRKSNFWLKLYKKCFCNLVAQLLDSLAVLSAYGLHG